MLARCRDPLPGPRFWIRVQGNIGDYGHVVGTHRDYARNSIYIEAADGDEWSVTHSPLPLLDAI